MPLMIDMVGVPQACTFWIYRYLWPIDLREHSPNCQHYFILGLLAWFLIVGANNKGEWPTIKYAYEKVRDVLLGRNPTS